MKKSELTQLTQLIEMLVTKEVRKQLPKLIGEVFTNMTGKAMVTENTHARTEEVQHIAPKSEQHAFKASLKDLFAGASVPMTRSELEEGVRPPPRVMKNYAKDPVLNQILNETTSDLRSREGPLASLAGGFGPAANVDMGQLVQPVSQATMLQEGHAPLSSIPDGVSVLDVAKMGAGVIAAPVQEALTNYDRMKKILDASKGKRY